MLAGSEALKQAKGMMATCGKSAGFIEDQETKQQVYGKGFLSAKDLERSRKIVELVFTQNNEIEVLIKAVVSLGSLPVPKPLPS